MAGQFVSLGLIRAHLNVLARSWEDTPSRLQSSSAAHFFQAHTDQPLVNWLPVWRAWDGESNNFITSLSYGFGAFMLVLYRCFIVRPPTMHSTIAPSYFKNSFLMFDFKSLAVSSRRQAAFPFKISAINLGLRFILFWISHNTLWDADLPCRLPGSRALTHGFSQCTLLIHGYLSHLGTCHFSAWHGKPESFTRSFNRLLFQLFLIDRFFDFLGRHLV